jgi:hypothetical protein
VLPIAHFERTFVGGQIFFSATQFPTLKELLLRIQNSHLGDENVACSSHISHMKGEWGSNQKDFWYNNLIRVILAFTLEAWFDKGWSLNNIIINRFPHMKGIKLTLFMLQVYLCFYIYFCGGLKSQFKSFIDLLTFGFEGLVIFLPQVTRISIPTYCTSFVNRWCHTQTKRYIQMDVLIKHWMRFVWRIIRLPFLGLALINDPRFHKFNI